MIYYVLYRIIRKSRNSKKKIDYANYMFIGNGYENSFIFSVNYV